MGDDSVRKSPSRTETLTVDRRQLEQLQKIASIGAVASSVAHEFNNILTTILNHAKLGQKSNDPQAMQRSFEKILTATRRAARITTGILALSRNRSERKQPTDVAALVSEVLVVLEKDLSKHQVRLEIDLGPCPKVNLVPQQIEQVLMNLIINARQAMQDGGVLKVGLTHNHETGMVEISVRDSGIGIEPERLARVFDPFYSTKDGPDQQGQGGSGLGLSICREIIERHFGRIRIESRVGHGTIFTLKLPISSSQSLPPTAA